MNALDLKTTAGNTYSMISPRLLCLSFSVAFVIPCISAFVVRTTPVRPRTNILNAVTTAAAAQDEELLHRALLGRRLSGDGNVSLEKAKSKPPSGGNPTVNRANGEDGATAYVGNLPYSVTEEQIRDLFEAYGTVKRIFLPSDRGTGRPKGFGFVTLGSREEMLAATRALDQSSFLGRIIYSNESVPKGQPLRKRGAATNKLYVSNISFQTTKEDLAAHFGQWGTVLDAYIPLDKDTGGPRGFSFVTLAKEGAEKALEEGNGSELNGRTLSVSIPLPKGQKSLRRERTRTTKLYVGNLSFNEDTESIRSLFSQYGDVLDCYMPLDKNTGQSRGFCFVSLESDAAMRAVDQTDGYEFNGRILRVNEAQPKNAAGGARFEVDYGYDDGSDDDEWGGDDDSSWGSESY